MNELESLIFNLKNFDPKTIINNILADPKIGDEIILIIQKRLYNEGKTAKEIKLRTDGAIKAGLPNYSPLGAFLKGGKGQRISNVTLRDTEVFYNSFISEFRSGFLRLKADFRNIYNNFTKSFSNEVEFHTAILDITDSELQFLFDNFIYPKIVKLTNRHFGL